MVSSTPRTSASHHSHTRKAPRPTTSGQPSLQPPDVATPLPASMAAPLQLEHTALELEGPFPPQTHSPSATPHPSGKNLGNILVSLLPQFPRLRGDLAQRTLFFSVATFVGVFLIGRSQWLPSNFLSWLPAPTLQTVTLVILLFI